MKSRAILKHQMHLRSGENQNLVDVSDFLFSARGRGRGVRGGEG